MENLEFIYRRHSVRKFKDEVIKEEHINEIIKAATYAPSAKNLQNWHFIVVKNKEKIKEAAAAVERKNAEIAEKIQDEEMKNNFKKFLKFQTVFVNAPVVIFVYAGLYTPTGLNELKASGAPEADIIKLQRSAPEVQGVAAAIENMMLAASTLGYGTCWMTGPNYAGDEIGKVLGFDKEGYILAAVTPIGIPETQEGKNPPRKPIEEIMTVIE
jgi:nitroreductase